MVLLNVCLNHHSLVVYLLFQELQQWKILTRGNLPQQPLLLDSFQLHSSHPSTIPLQQLPHSQHKPDSSSDVKSGVISLKAAHQLTKNKQGLKPHGNVYSLTNSYGLMLVKSLWSIAQKRWQSKHSYGQMKADHISMEGRVNVFHLSKAWNCIKMNCWSMIAIYKMWQDTFWKLNNKLSNIFIFDNSITHKTSVDWAGRLLRSALLHLPNKKRTNSLNNKTISLFLMAGCIISWNGTILLDWICVVKWQRLTRDSGCLQLKIFEKEYKKNRVA